MVTNAMVVHATDIKLQYSSLCVLRRLVRYPKTIAALHRDKDNLDVLTTAALTAMIAFPSHVAIQAKAAAILSTCCQIPRQKVSNH